jgi:hypothetical protein
MELLAAYPPDRYFYVGVGRSPSALVEALQAFVPHGAQGFPVSGLSARAGRAISDEERTEYYRHLDHFFPKPERLRGRTILLMDSVSAGATLLKMKEIFADFLGSRRIEARVETMSLNNHHPDIDHVLPGRFRPMQAGSADIARYDAHYIGEEKLEGLRVNPARKPFVRSLLARLYGDSYADRLVARGFKPLHVLAEKERKTLLDTDEADDGAGSTSRVPVRRQGAERAIHRALAESFEGAGFVHHDRSTPQGELVMRVDRRREPAGWVVSTRVPAELWAAKLATLGSELDALARRPHAHSAPFDVRVSLPLDGGEVQPERITVERVPGTVRLSPLEIDRGEIAVRREPRSGPKPTASAEELTAYLEKGLSNTFFRDDRGGPRKSATLLLERSSPKGPFTVRSAVPREGWAHAFEHTGRAFDGLARRMDTTTLRVDLDFDAHGMVRDVRIARYVPSAIVQPGVSNTRTLELGDTPAKVDATPEMLAQRLAQGFREIAYTTPSGEHARSISFEFQPTEDWAGRAALKLTSEAELKGPKAHIDAAIPMLDRLTRSVGGPGPRSGLRVTLPLKNGEVQTEGASVERLEPRFALRPNHRLGSPIRIPARDDGASESVNVPSLERELAESFQGMTFHTPEGKPARRVRLEVRIDTGGELMVYSDVPEGAFRHAVERYARPLERLSRDASDPSKRRWVEIDLPLDDQGRVNSGQVQIRQL